MDNYEFLSVLAWKYINVYNFVVSTYKGGEHVTTYSFSLIWYESTPSGGDISQLNLYVAGQRGSTILCWVVMKSDNYLKDHENYLDNDLHTISVKVLAKGFGCVEMISPSLSPSLDLLMVDVQPATSRIRSNIYWLSLDTAWYLLTLLQISQRNWNFHDDLLQICHDFPDMIGCLVSGRLDLMSCLLGFVLLKWRWGPPLPPPAYEWLSTGFWEILIFKAMSWDSFNSQNPL